MSTTCYGPQRNYCHPIDTNIIRVLDNPAVNLVFRKVLSVAADSSFGQLIATGVPVNERSFPNIHKIVKQCSETLRIPMPYVIVSSSVGFNAFTTGSDQKPYIVLGSMLVKAMREEYLHFVIGHECGHIAMGHVLYQSVANAMAHIASNVPVIGQLVNSTAGLALNAWSRRSEISADRAGLLCCGNLETAQYALLQIEMGLIDAENTNLDDYIDSSNQFRKEGIIRRLGEFNQSHPLIPKRIEALELFTESSLLYRIAGCTPPPDTLNYRTLERKIEELLKVV